MSKNKRIYSLSSLILSAIALSPTIQAGELKSIPYNLSKASLIKFFQEVNLRRLCIFRVNAELDEKPEVVNIIENEFISRQRSIKSCIKDKPIADLFQNLIKYRVAHDQMINAENEYQDALRDYLKASKRSAVTSSVNNSINKQKNSDTERRVTIYTRIGDTVFGSNGETLQVFGNNVIGNKRTLHTYGSMTTSSDGTTYNTIGNITFGSDGSTCHHFNNISMCR